MKLTIQALKQIIREELQRTLLESQGLLFVLSDAIKELGGTGPEIDNLFQAFIEKHQGKDYNNPEEILRDMEIDDKPLFWKLKKIESGETSDYGRKRSILDSALIKLDPSYADKLDAPYKASIRSLEKQFGKGSLIGVKSPEGGEEINTPEDYYREPISVPPEPQQQLSPRPKIRYKRGTLGTGSRTKYRRY